MKNPIIFLVPGAWRIPEIYHGVEEILRAHGYHTISIRLPSAGAMPPIGDFDDDVKRIRIALEERIEDQGRDVVLVSRSYSSMPATEAPKGMRKIERQGKGLKEGLVRLVFIMSFTMPEEFQPTAGGNRSRSR